MVLNKTTLHSGTGEYLIKLIKELLSIVPADDFDSNSFNGIRRKLEYIEVIYNEPIIKSKSI